MALPKLDTPTYTLDLPSTGEKIKYSPFLVKEQKLLMMAQEGGDEKDLIEIISSIISSCTFNNVKVNQVPLFDIEYIFLKLRSKSVGEETELGFKCLKEDCDGVTPVKVNIDEIKVNKSEKHTRKILITDEIGVMMSYPSLNTNGVIEEDGMKIVKECIEMIFTNDETHERDQIDSKELDDFLESMDTKQFGKIKEFFETMPRLQHDLNFSCVKCGEERKVTLQGIDSFFG